MTARTTQILGMIATLAIAGSAFSQLQRNQANPNAMPAWPEAEFHFARLAYDSHGAFAGSRGGRQPMWAIDYPSAEAHFLPTLERFTRIEAADDSAHVQLSDPRIFDYPWLFMQQLGAGGWDPSPTDMATLREYLLRGGFLVVDDFHGEDEWLRFESVIYQVLPGRPIVDLTEDSALLNIVFDVDNLTQIPGERHLDCCGGPPRMEGPPHWRGIFDDEGRLIVAINHNIDMGDAWEHADEAHYPVEMTGLAYRYGVNYVIYAMTH